MMRIDTILQTNQEKWHQQAYIFEKIHHSFVSHTYGEFYEQVIKIAYFLQEKKLFGKKIAIYAENSYDYMVADVAIMGYVGISVAVSPLWNVRDMQNIMDEIGLDAIIYAKEKEETVQILHQKYPHTEYISFEEIYTQTANTIPPSQIKIHSEECVKIIFSSGTTGFPKAVMLSQKNIFTNLNNLLKRADMNDRDTCYLFLPLNHTYGGICNFLYSLHTGMKIYLCSDKNRIMEELQEVKPSVFSCVPLVLEKIYQYSQSHCIPVTTLLGGNIRFLFCGGAVLEPEIRKSLKEEGICLLEAYGLSETTSLISLEYPNKEDYTSVGTVFENMQIYIDHPNAQGIGEIMAKGDNIFIGYYNKMDAYHRCFNSEGFFHTGDLGYMQENKLFLVGRKKRMIVQSNARNIYPDELEALIAKQVDADAIKVFEKNHIICCHIYSNLLSSSDSHKILGKINQVLPKYCQIEELEIIKNTLDTKLK